MLVCFDFLNSTTFYWIIHFCQQCHGEFTCKNFNQNNQMSPFLYFVCRIQTHLLVRDSVCGHGVRSHLPVQQHHRLHERHGRHHGRHHDRPALRGLLPLRGRLQYKPGPPISPTHVSFTFSGSEIFLCRVRNLWEWNVHPPSLLWLHSRQGKSVLSTGKSWGDFFSNFSNPCSRNRPRREQCMNRLWKNI